MLYLALLFPELAWENFTDWRISQIPWALIEARRIVLANSPAQLKGVHAGQSISAALALEPNLVLATRQIEAEITALRRRAEWAMRFSAEVSLQDHSGLLLEIASALRYFGGVEALLKSIRESLQSTQLAYQWAVAPTPLAAWWAVQCQSGFLIHHLEQVPGGIGKLPVQAMTLPAEIQAALLGVGVQNIADLLCLPRHTLAHRFGPGLPLLLDKAIGTHPDPRVAYVPENRFSIEHELDSPTHDLSQLQRLIHTILPALVHWNTRQGREVRRIALTLAHDKQAASYMPIGFAGSTRLEHLQLVIDEHLARLDLPHPVTGLRLQQLEWEDASCVSVSLLPTHPSRLQQGKELLERLRARLGDQAVMGLQGHADYRPERAWRYVEPGYMQDLLQGAKRKSSSRALANRSLASSLNLPPRPLWLLEKPRDLGAETFPIMDRPLALLSGPERIESGWWDGEDVARDYFIAEAQGGPRYWVYRDCRGDLRWFLQGVFA